ncbi:MAG: O-antigen ligase family protein [Candidatus Gracilibacteria bacterium]
MMQLKTIKSFTKLVLAVLVLTLPLQISSLIYEPLWGRGFANNFINIYLNLTEVLIALGIFGLLITNFLEKKRINTGPKLFLIPLLFFLGLALISIFLSPYKEQVWHFFLAIKIIEIFPLYILLISNVLKKEDLIKLFSFAMSLQAFWAILQVLFQKSLGLTALGEPNISNEIAQLAKITFDGFTFIRGYGTFSHPNILGGFLTISILSTIAFIKPLNKDHKILILLQIFGLLASFSRSAILALIVGLLCLISNQKAIRTWVKRTIAGLLGLVCTTMFFLNGLPWGTASFLERIAGYKTAIEMIKNHIAGVGFNSHTLFLEEILGTSLKPWEYQPVHNIFLLIGTEMGLASLIFAIIMLGFLLKKTFHKKPAFILMIALITLGFFDHYLLSLSQGIYLAIFVFGVLAMSYEGKTDFAKSA